MPTLDVCSDEHGTNALAAQYFSAKENSLKQRICAHKVFANPPFNTMIDTFARKIERQLFKHPAAHTEAVMLIPYRPSKQYYQNLMGRNRWRVLQWYPANMKLFWKPRDRDHYCTRK